MLVNMVRNKGNWPQLRPSVRRHMSASSTRQSSVNLYGGDRHEYNSLKSEFADTRTQIWDSLYAELGSFSF